MVVLDFYARRECIMYIHMKMDKKEELRKTLAAYFRKNYGLGVYWNDQNFISNYCRINIQRWRVNSISLGDADIRWA